MKTEVIMKRELFGKPVCQKSKSGFFSATDLVAAGNVWRVTNGLPIFKLQAWLYTDATKAFIAHLEEETGAPVKMASKGRNGKTWVHPFLFMDLALALSPKLKYEVYSWMTDELLKYRSLSGDSYKTMCGALYINAKRKDTFPAYIAVVAQKIKNLVGVDSWEGATEEMLYRRDKVHKEIALLADVLRNNDDAVEIALERENW